MVFLAKIAVVVAVRMMIVLHPASLTLPIASEIPLAIVVRRHPASSPIRRASPISFMPLVVAADWIPIAVHPDKIGTRGYWPNANHARRGWRANPDAQGYISGKCQSYSEQHQSKQFLRHELPSL
jgi:hypothetical protein